MFVVSEIGFLEYNSHIMLDLFCLAILCLIWALGFFLVLDIFVFRWVASVNMRILLFLALFAMCYGNTCRRARSAHSGIPALRSSEKMTIAEKYAELTHNN